MLIWVAKLISLCPLYPTSFNQYYYGTGRPAYAHLFCKRVFAHVQVLLTGAVLRIMGLGQTEALHKYHRVLSQAQWSVLAASRLLLEQLLSAFIGQGPLIVGIVAPHRDETLVRRWVKCIKHHRPGQLPGCGS